MNLSYYYVLHINKSKNIICSKLNLFRHCIAILLLSILFDNNGMSNRQQWYVIHCHLYIYILVITPSLCLFLVLQIIYDGKVITRKVMFTIKLLTKYRVLYYSTPIIIRYFVYSRTRNNRVRIAICE